MTIIQTILLGAGVIWLVSYLARARVAGLPRLLGLLGVVAAMLFVIFPDVTTMLATLAGVGRGVDLVIYLSLAGMGFLWLHETARRKELEVQFTALAREFALCRAIENPETFVRTNDTAQSSRE